MTKVVTSQPGGATASAPVSKVVRPDHLQEDSHQLAFSSTGDDRSFCLLDGVDTLVVEEPLEVRVAAPGADPVPVAVVMRTPGDDFDLAWGMVLTEGIAPSPDALSSAHWGSPADFNVVEVRLADGSDASRLADRRPWLSSSSCGLCGRDAIAAIAQSGSSLANVRTSVPASVLLDLPASLREEQKLFATTGGLHAAGAFRPDGSAVCVREDIGRHNAVDKVVGNLARLRMLPAHDLVLTVSGRISFEIVQKASVAGFPVVAAVSAASSLAVELASSLSMTLAGFVREGSATIYHDPGRIVW
jgi:FdhD protein